MTLTYFGTFLSPFYAGGSPSSTGVPSIYDVAINGRGYRLDLKADVFGEETIPISRQQIDTTDSPSEASLSREDLWRRAFESWHHGAGQGYRDRPASDQYRFFSSRGMYVWERDSLSLLPDTSRGLSSAATNLMLTTIGSHLYVADGVNVRYSLNGTAWAAATGLSGSAILSLVSDGNVVYATDGADVYSSAAGGAFTVFNTLNCTLLGWNNGRLMAAQGPALYNITSGTPPTALFTHSNSNWIWTAFATGPNAVFAAGYSGDTSLIYRIPMKSDGSGLDVPVIDMELPRGERVLSMMSYLGYLCVGTTKGFRIMQIGISTFTAPLTSGPPIRVGPVRCLEGQDRYMRFGWDNYDATYTGLGRALLVPGVDSTAFTDTLTPAYASDLMAVTQGQVLSVLTWNNLTVFAISGSGVWLESATDLVPTATLVTGMMTYGLPDTKVLETVDLRFAPLAGTITLSVAGSDNSFAPLSPTVSDVGATGATIAAHEIAGDRFGLRIDFTRGSATTGPNMSRATLLANPAPARGLIWTLPLLLHERTELVNGTVQRYQARVERDYIALLADSGSLCTVQIDGETLQGFIVDTKWRGGERYSDQSDRNGTHHVLFKIPSRRGT